MLLWVTRSHNSQILRNLFYNLFINTCLNLFYTVVLSLSADKYKIRLEFTLNICIFFQIVIYHKNAFTLVTLFQCLRTWKIDVNSG